MSTETEDGAGPIPQASRRDRIIGGLFVLGPAQFLLVLLVGASIVPDYSVHANAISDLGVAPSTALLFDASVVAAGVANVAAGRLAYWRHGRRWLLGVFALAGLGSICVGLFPENTGAPHLVAALFAFVFLNVEAIACGFRSRGALRVLGILAGLVGLGFLAVFIADAGSGFGALGAGGVERFVVYPVLLWLIAYGGAHFQSGSPESG